MKIFEYINKINIGREMTLDEMDQWFKDHNYSLCNNWFDELLPGATTEEYYLINANYQRYCKNNECSIVCVRLFLELNVQRPQPTLSARARARVEAAAAEENGL